MSQLFTPINLGPVTLPNRIIIAPMCQYSAIDGQATEWHTIHLGQLAFSGAGLLIVEATAVEPEGRISPNDLGLWDDKTEQALATTIQAVKKYSTMPLAIQLAHAGRKASMPAPWQPGPAVTPEHGGWQPVAPSAIPYDNNSAQPLELTTERIESIIASFAHSAKRADKLGFDVIEVHAAHGYLLHEFLSPISNHRQDMYGGSLDNRMRLTLAVFSAIRKVFPAHKSVGVRISASDWVENGWDLAQSLELCHQLKKLGCDYIHVSSGGLSAQQHIPVSPNYQVPFARRIKEEVGMPTIAVGLITEPEQAEAIVATGEADMVALARGILYNPRWPWHAAAELGAQVSAPKQYWRSQPHRIKNLFLPD
ncbi:NADH:flavin oxidoreductase/NADH oxidase [Pragia fontium]|uniref:2,4-dienoyl-CoA reductase n=2 Tax=Pragia fontium TaxID=82985 RepID=A0AAJ4WA27_9GAMM|nr:NADH:flavin oxidoreductase/NADH oxidase [Pragia fontium]GKX63538.1 oxidoreductase [Pragia fontium]SFC67754.1 2,4-dienoyl-CoA reductase [Pragia fontium DSM 5563 = ATCC 49100]